MAQDVYWPGLTGASLGLELCSIYDFHGECLWTRQCVLQVPRDTPYKQREGTIPTMQQRSDFSMASEHIRVAIIGSGPTMGAQARWLDLPSKQNFCGFGEAERFLAAEENQRTAAE
jgi:hypothetical protein